MSRQVPRQKPGKSKSTYGTPRELILAAEHLIGAKFVLDLAASARNAVTRRYIDKKRDSLSVDWTKEARGGWCWLNPPFSRIEPWALKCAYERRRGCKIAFHVPASVGSNWYIEHVFPNAMTMLMSPRVIYVGETDPFPKDCILALFGREAGKVLPWRWDFITAPKR